MPERLCDLWWVCHWCERRRFRSLNAMLQHARAKHPKEFPGIYRS